MPPRSALSSELIAAVEAGATVLTSNRRGAHWLKLLYANYAVAEGRRAWVTPAIDSIDAFLERLWRAKGSPSERVLTREQSNLLWDRVVAASRWSSTLLSPQAAATSSFRSWERLQAWRIGRADLARYADASQETRALLEWSDRFHDLYAERGWLPSALLPNRLLEVAGNFDLREVITLAQDDLFPNQRTALEHLVASGTRWRELEMESTDTDAEATACPSVDDEIRFAANWARAQLLNGAKSIGIVVPDLAGRMDQVRRLCSDVLASNTRSFEPKSRVPGEQGFADRQYGSFAIAGFHRLDEFPVARAAIDLLRFAVGRATPVLTGALLRNPFLSAADTEGSQRALADLAIRSEVREYYDFGTLERIADCPVLKVCLRNARTLQRGAPSRALPSAVAELFVQLWRAFGWPGHAPSSEEQQVVSRLHAALAEFGALDELLGPLSFASSVRLFEQLTHEIAFEPRSVPAAITVVDAHIVAGLQFDGVWVTGMDEHRWPPAASPDPYIPIELQSRAKMPFATAQLTRAHAHKQFLGLKKMGRQAVFSWARSDQDAEVLPSPWIGDFANGASGAPKNFSRRIYDARPVLETMSEERAPAPVTASTRGGSRIFELQSLCPFRAFAELRLGAPRLEEMSAAVDSRDRGILLHAALADIWEELKSSATLLARTREDLVVLVRTSLARHAAKLLEGASSQRVRMLQIEQDLATERILELLDVDRERLPFRVVGRPEARERASVGALTFDLRLDRVDELLEGAEQGKHVIVDYKTGGDIRTPSWRRSRPEQPQLPLYAVTHQHPVAAIAAASVSAKAVAYQGEAADDGLLPGVKAFNGKNIPPEYVGWEGLLAYWGVVMERLSAEFVSGDARIDPLNTACRYCHLSTLCRLSEQQDEGRALQDEEAP